MLSHESKVTVGSILPTMDMLPFSLLRGLVVDSLTSQALHLFLAAFTRRLMIGLSPVQRFSFRIWSMVIYWDTDEAILSLSGSIGVCFSFVIAGLRITSRFKWSEDNRDSLG